MPKRKPAVKAITKVAFVKSQPASLSAKEVVQKAKDTGMKLTDKYVYTVRSAAKAKSRRSGRAKDAATKPAAAKAVTRGSTSVEDLLRAAAAELGLSRAISILSEQQNAVRAMLGPRG